MARWLALVALVGCGGGSSGAADLAVPADLAQAAPDQASRSDKQVCDDACASLIGCGVLYDATCSANCQTKAPVFLACARTAGTDCNALALCSFQQFSASACGGGTAGVPAGSTTCHDYRDCNGACIDSKGGAPCFCACAKGLSPSLALDALVDSQCSSSRCPGPCATSAAACAACQSQNCATQVAQCANH